MKHIVVALAVVVSGALLMGAGTVVNTPGVPSGAIMAFARATCPTGWVAADGVQKSRTTYARLYAAVCPSGNCSAWGAGDGSTTFNAPDLREVTVVGSGTYAAVSGSPVRTNHVTDVFSLGGFKSDLMQGHYHTAGAYRLNATAFGASNVAIANSTGTVSNGDTAGPITDGSNGTPRTGVVTRMKSIGVLYCIKD